MLECTPIALAKELFEVNYFGILRLIQAVLPSMKARESGHIINNSSHLGVVGTPFNELYCSTKFAIEGLTEALAPTLLHFNIRYSECRLKLVLKISFVMFFPRGEGVGEYNLPPERGGKDARTNP